MDIKEEPIKMTNATAQTAVELLAAGDQTQDLPLDVQAPSVKDSAEGSDLFLNCSEPTDARNTMAEPPTSNWLSNSERLATRSRKLVRVHLPHPKPFVDLTTNQAALLNQIIAAGEAGVSSLELIDAGHISPQNTVSTLRGLGAVIETRRDSVADWKGSDREGIAFYTYKYWI